MDVPSSRRFITAPRKVANYLVLAICAALAIHVWGVEPFEVPTGSMAPALLGHHRACICPNCGFDIVVGRHPADADGTGHRAYRSIVCPNCGTGDLGLDAITEAAGDRILVNKSVFALRRPRRWEIVVFRRNGKLYVKRILGLPGEEIEIRDGDIYVGGELLRKTLEEVRETRVLLSTELMPKCGVVTSEYTYNGRSAFRPETVHDFCIECDIDVRQGEGTLRIGLTDGNDEVFADLPFGRAGSLVFVSRPQGNVHAKETLQGARNEISGLERGRTYKLEFAFVDRRVSIALDGKTLADPIDLPPASRRKGVDRPFVLEARGCDIAFKTVRLYRDLHYTQSGRNAVCGNSVHLPVDQYFVLGDNSDNSEDSRSWPDHGAVHERDLVGKPFLVYLPSRTVTWTVFGRSGQVRLPDPARVRWLR